MVFTQTESRAVIAEMKGARRLIAGLLYGSGLRIMEAVRKLHQYDLKRGYGEVYLPYALESTSTEHLYGPVRSL